MRHPSDGLAPPPLPPDRPCAATAGSPLHACPTCQLRAGVCREPEAEGHLRWAQAFCPKCFSKPHPRGCKRLDESGGHWTSLALASAAAAAKAEARSVLYLPDILTHVVDHVGLEHFGTTKCVCRDWRSAVADKHLEWRLLAGVERTFGALKNAGYVEGAPGQGAGGRG